MKRVQRLSLGLLLGFVIVFVPFTVLGQDSKEGQTIFTNALVQPTRRFDVDTQWTREIGHIAGKILTARFNELHNQSEDVVVKFREPASNLAGVLFR